MLNLNECERSVLTDVLQHEAGQVGGAAVGGINGRDVDDVVGEELQVGQLEVPHLRKNNNSTNYYYYYNKALKSYICHKKRLLAYSY